MSRAACVGITPHADKTEIRTRQGSLTAPLHAKLRKDMAKIKIAKGNAFVYSLPLVELNADGTKENVQATDVQDLQVICARACGASFEPEFTSDGNRLYISFAADLQVAEYNLTVTGSLHAVQDFALQMQAAFEIVQWDSQSNWRDYIIGDAIVPEDTPLIAGVFNSDEEWERLKEELRLQIAAAQAAEEAAEAAKREWEQKAAELDDVAQEATLTQGVQDIRADIAGIEIDTSDLAKQGTNPNANITDIQNSLSPVAAAAEAYNTGKVELAANITSKGVQASATETLPELAEKVAGISQESYTIDGGEMYAKQLFGSLETPNYWNLYEVLANLLSDGRLINYGGILLAEYYRGYDSIALAGAGAGGAYVVSDMENGQFKMYTEDTTHTWAAEFDGRGNRWVAYCFADEYHDFQITDTKTSPRSIFIGRKVGTITSLVNGRCSQIVVPDGNELRDFRAGTYTQNFGKSVTLCNLSHTSGNLLYNQANIETLYVKLNRCTGGVICNTNGASMPNTMIFECDNCQMTGNLVHTTVQYDQPLTTLIIKANTGKVNITSTSQNNVRLSHLKNIYVLDVDNLSIEYRVYSSDYQVSGFKMFIGYSHENPTGGNFTLYSPFGIAAPQVGWGKFTDLELQNGWNKPINVSHAVSLTEPNIYTHILQRLKQDEPDCGDGVTITLGSTNLAKLTSEESMALLQQLTDVYKYRFN